MESDNTSLDLYTKSEASLSTVCVSGFRVPTWTDSLVCTEECQIYNKCKSNNVGELCSVQKSFLGCAIKSVLKSLPKPVSDETLSRIGLILIPLYSDLFLMLLEKSALNKVTVGNGVNVKMHPIFKSIKETILAIDKQHEKISLSKLAIKKMKDIGGDMVHGDSDYYDSISK